MKIKKQAIIKKRPYRLSHEQKAEIFEFYKANPDLRLIDIAEKFGTNMTTVSDIISMNLPKAKKAFER